MRRAGCIRAISRPSTSRAIARIVGRLKDMLIRGGENIYPREIEEFLLRHPKVQSAQVFGVPDHRLGEEVCAFIVLKPNQSATRGGNTILLPRADLASQSAALHSLRAGIPDDSDRQAAKIRHARADHRRIGRCRSWQGCLSGVVAVILSGNCGCRRSKNAETPSRKSAVAAARMKPARSASSWASSDVYGA